MQFDTSSEEHFAEYLTNSGYVWDRHPSIPGQSKIPDFAFEHSGVRVLVDIKERTPSQEVLDRFRRQRARTINPVEQVRHLIRQGRRKFKDFDGHQCVLVLYNNGHPEMRLDPYTVFGAMLGDPGFTVSLNPRTARLDITTLQSGFLPRGGAMLRSYDPLTPSGSLGNISAVVALEAQRIPNPQFDVAHSAEVNRLADQFRRPVTREESVAIVGSLMIDQGVPYSLGSDWGLTVCINPHAKMVLPDDLFCGSLDERWEMTLDGVTRIFQGKQRAAIDAQSNRGSDGEE